MTALEEIVICLDTRNCGVTIQVQISYTSIGLYIKYSQIWESNTKTNLEVVACVLERYFSLVFLCGRMADC